MRHLFFVHGMGANPSGWSDSIANDLDELSLNYSWFKSNGPFTKFIHRHELRYDGVLEKYVYQWKQSGDALRAAAKDQKLKLPKTLALLSSATLPDDVKTTFWTTLIDPVLYRGFTEVRKQVRNLVMDQIVKVLTEAGGGAMPAASVLCHSQGTIVTHDVLATLGSDPTINRAFMPPAFRFESLFMLANVSRLGPADIDPYKSCVRPGSAPVIDKGYYCQRLYSFRHHWDPFTWWQTFEPRNWGSDYYESTLGHVHSANVHGFPHYLRHPDVHVPIFNRMVIDARLEHPVIDRKERLDAVARFPSIQPAACAAAIDALKTRCEGLRDAVRSPKNLDEVVDAGLAFFQAAREAERACASLGHNLPA